MSPPLQPAWIADVLTWPPRGCRPVRNPAQLRGDRAVRARSVTDCGRARASRRTGSRTVMSGGRAVLRPHLRGSAAVRSQQMGVDHAESLHEREHRGGADETEPVTLELLRQGDRLGTGGGDVLRGRGHRGALGPVGPDQIRQIGAGPELAARAEPVEVAQGDRGPRVGDRRLDLAAMADDALVVEQPLDVLGTEIGHDLDLESGEGPPEPFASAQDRRPGQPGLEPLEGEALEDSVLVTHREAPLGVVVVAEVLVHGGPGRPVEPVGPEDETVGHQSSIFPMISRFSAWNWSSIRPSAQYAETEICSRGIPESFTRSRRSCLVRPRSAWQNTCRPSVRDRSRPRTASSSCSRSPTIQRSSTPAGRGSSSASSSWSRWRSTRPSACSSMASRDAAIAGSAAWSPISRWVLVPGCGV